VEREAPTRPVLQFSLSRALGRKEDSPRCGFAPVTVNLNPRSPPRCAAMPAPCALPLAVRPNRVGCAAALRDPPAPPRVLLELVLLHVAVAPHHSIVRPAPRSNSPMPRSKLWAAGGRGAARDGNGSGKCGYGVCLPASVPAPLAFARPQACPWAKTFARDRLVSAGIGQPAICRSRPRSPPQRGRWWLQVAMHRPTRRVVESRAATRRPSMVAPEHDGVSVGPRCGRW
jgi:hypothetical protein